MEYPYPYPQSTDLSVLAIILHLLLLGAAVLPIVGLFRQSRRPARSLDAWLWVGCVFLFPLPLVIAVAALPEHARPFLLGLFLFAEAIAVIAMLITVVRLWRQGQAVSAALVLSGLFALALLVMLCLPAVPAAREAARRMQCSNHIKQLVVAMLNYHDEHKFLPMAVSVEANGTESSWRVFLQPYVEGSPRQFAYDPAQPWTSEHNTAIAQEKRELLTCPSNLNEKDDRGRYYTAYAMLLGPDAALSKNQRRTLSDATAGTNNVLAVVEACGRNIVWTKPEDVDASTLPLGINRPGRVKTMSDGIMSSLHPGGAQAGLLDGSVRSFSESIDPEVLRQLTSRTKEVEGEY